MKAGVAGPVIVAAVVLVSTSCGFRVGADDRVDGDLGQMRSEVVDADAEEGDDPAVDESVDTVEIVVPDLPPIALPDISVLSETGDIVAEQLGELVTGPLGGVELVSASCADEGDLVYSGSQTGSDLFDIEQDGSGAYQEQSDDGLVSLEVEPDGSGQFYDSTAGGLVTIQVSADGRGEYYSERGSDLVTIKVTGEGSGEYYDNRDDQLLTVQLMADGSGEYYRESETGLLTVKAAADGSGQYFFEDALAGRTSTMEVRPDGSWTLNTIESSRRFEVVVNDDGSGSYQVSGLDTAGFAFDVDGRSTTPGVDARILLPEPPRFSVADEFPALGKLGSLNPPCATVIRFDSALLFDFGQAELLPETVELLAQVVDAVEQVGKPIEIVGHTDSIGSDEANLELSLRRAEAVEAALLQNGMTVAADVTGVGETEPVADNENADGSDNPAGRAENRRVEIVIRE